MIAAVKEAAIALSEGNFPYGAILADKTGKIIIKAHNTTVTDRDITAHAEMNLLKKAFKKLKIVDLAKYLIITNAEPCSMCASACIKAGLKEFYYGAPIGKIDNPFMGLKEIVAKAKGKIVVKGGIEVDL